MLPLSQQQSSAGRTLPICIEQQFLIHHFKGECVNNPTSPLRPGSYLERADKWAGWNWYWAAGGVMIPLACEIHLWGGTHQQHLWWLQTWQPWHIPLFIPHTKHSHNFIIISGEILISTCPSMLQFPWQPPCCLHTAVLTSPAPCAFQVLTARGAASGALWCQSQSLSWLLCKAWKSPLTEKKLLPRPASPASSSIRAGKGTGSSSLGLLSFRWVLEISWVFVPKPTQLLSWASQLLPPLAQLGQPRGMADCPKHSRNHPHSWYKIHLLFSHTPGSVWAWQGQRRGSSASFFCYLPNTATYSLTSHPPPQYFCSSFKRLYYLLNWAAIQKKILRVFLMHPSISSGSALLISQGLGHLKIINSKDMIIIR